MKKFKLEIELIPKSMWYKNVRSEVPRAIWDIIRKKCYNLAGNKCEISGQSGITQGFRHSVECHELWEFNDNTHTQTLIGFIALSPLTHKCKHIGLAEIQGFYNKVKSHFIEVNQCTLKDFENHEKEQWSKWEERNKYEWTLNIEYYKQYINE